MLGQCGERGKVAQTNNSHSWQAWRVDWRDYSDPSAERGQDTQGHESRNRPAQGSRGYQPGAHQIAAASLLGALSSELCAQGSFVEGWYDVRRVHGSLGYHSPLEFENLHARHQPSL